jgi:peroxiredoxin
MICTAFLPLDYVYIVLYILLAVMLISGILAMVPACSDRDAGQVTAGALPGPAPSNVVFLEPPGDAPPAPSFDLELLDGELLNAGEQWSQRPMVLVFFETWCEACRDSQAEFNDLAGDYQDVVLFVGVAGRSSPDEVRRYVAEHDVRYPVGVDTDDSRWLKYAVAEPPLVALISKDGRLMRGWPGGISAAELREHIDRLVLG